MTVLVVMMSAACASEPPPSEMDRAIREATFRSMYNNYRKAIATNNLAFQRSLRPRMLERKDTAISYAEKELREAKRDLDRQIAQSVIDSLRE